MNFNAQHILGKDGVHSSNLCGGTIQPPSIPPLPGMFAFPATCCTIAERGSNITYFVRNIRGRNFPRSLGVPNA